MAGVVGGVGLVLLGAAMVAGYPAKVAIGVYTCLKAQQRGDGTCTTTGSTFTTAQPYDGSAQLVMIVAARSPTTPIWSRKPTCS